MILFIQDGQIISLYVVKYAHPAFRVVKLMSNWEPASDGFRSRKMCFTLPISFKL